MSDIPRLNPVNFGGGTVDIDRYFSFAYDDISIASQDLPRLIEWLNEQRQALDYDAKVAKQTLKTARGRAFLTLRGGQFEELGYAGSPTDAAVRAAVELDADVIKAAENLANLESWVKRLSSTMVDLSLKIDLVRSTESTRRHVFDPAHEEVVEDDDES